MLFLEPQQVGAEQIAVFGGAFARLAGLPVEPLRLRLCLLIISAFLLGGSAGALAFHRLNYNALYLPASLAAIMALAYALYRHTRRHTG